MSGHGKPGTARLPLGLLNLIAPARATDFLGLTPATCTSCHALFLTPTGAPRTRCHTCPGDTA